MHRHDSICAYRDFELGFQIKYYSSNVESFWGLLQHIASFMSKADDDELSDWT